MTDLTPPYILTGSDPDSLSASPHHAIASSVWSSGHVLTGHSLHCSDGLSASLPASPHQEFAQIICSDDAAANLLFQQPWMLQALREVQQCYIFLKYSNVGVQLLKFYRGYLCIYTIYIFTRTLNLCKEGHMENRVQSQRWFVEEDVGQSSSVWSYMCTVWTSCHRRR